MKLTEKQLHKLFMTRTAALYANDANRMNREYFAAAYKGHKTQCKAAKATPKPLDRFITSQPIETRIKLPFTLDFLRAQVEIKLGSPCPYCSEKLTIKNVSLDHAIPVTRRLEFAYILEPFGEDLLTAAFSWGNSVLSCLECNKRKGTMTAIDFKALLESVSLMSPKSASYVLRQLALKAHWF